MTGTGPVPAGGFWSARCRRTPDAWFLTSEESRWTYKVPRYVRLLAGPLPELASGKVDRRGAAALADPALATDLRPPGSLDDQGVRR
jgi:hypothetical protein